MANSPGFGGKIVGKSSELRSRRSERKFKARLLVRVREDEKKLVVSLVCREGCAPCVHSALHSESGRESVREETEVCVENREKE